MKPFRIAPSMWFWSIICHIVFQSVLYYLALNFAMKRVPHGQSQSMVIVIVGLECVSYGDIYFNSFGFIY